MSRFNSQEIWKELKEKGYCVVPNVLTPEQCDEFAQQLKDWSSTQKGLDYTHVSSLINLHQIGHLDTIWKVRLLAKDVFAAMWETDKLVSSFDKISMAAPPEAGSADFDTGYSWLHLDRDGRRRGVHAVQGGVYLEETAPTDQCLRVMEGSNKYTDEFFSQHPLACAKSRGTEHYILTEDEVEWFKAKGCAHKVIPAPKGSLLLWDSRTVHDNKKVTEGRPHVDRWRFVVLVCMLPAKWLDKEDLRIKRYAYENMLLTCHMPCLKVRVHRRDEGASECTLIAYGETTKSCEVKKLVGIEKYDFNDGQPNGPPLPLWITN